MIHCMDVGNCLLSKHLAVNTYKTDQAMETKRICILLIQTNELIYQYQSAMILPRFRSRYDLFLRFLNKNIFKKFVYSDI